MTFDTLELTIPSHWLCPIAYGDTTGLDDAEECAFDRWYVDHVREFGPITLGDVSDDPYFARYHDAAEYGVLACDCLDVTFMFAAAECVAA
jgi:hypothetical protein